MRVGCRLDALYQGTQLLLRHILYSFGGDRFGQRKHFRPPAGSRIEIGSDVEKQQGLLEGLFSRHEMKRLLGFHDIVKNASNLQRTAAGRTELGALESRPHAVVKEDAPLFQLTVVDAQQRQESADAL